MYMHVLSMNTCLYASFLTGQGHQGILFLVKGTLVYEEIMKLYWERTSSAPRQWPYQACTLPTKKGNYKMSMILYSVFQLWITKVRIKKRRKSADLRKSFMPARWRQSPLNLCLCEVSSMCIHEPFLYLFYLIRMQWHHLMNNQRYPRQQLCS